MALVSVGRKKAIIKSDYGRALRESVVDTIDDLLDWNVVPPTTAILLSPTGKEPSWHPLWNKNKPQTVSIQEWIENAVPFYTWSKDKPQTVNRLIIFGHLIKENSKNELRLWRIAALDAIINNIDRHDGNIVINKKTGLVWAIDNGLSFEYDCRPSGNRIIEWASDSGGILPSPVLHDLRALDEGDLRAALSPLPFQEIEDAIKRWKNLKKAGSIQDVWPGLPVARSRNIGCWEPLNRHPT